MSFKVGDVVIVLDIEKEKREFSYEGPQVGIISMLDTYYSTYEIDGLVNSWVREKSIVLATPLLQELI